MERAGCDSRIDHLCFEARWQAQVARRRVGAWLSPNWPGSECLQLIARPRGQLHTEPGCGTSPSVSLDDQVSPSAVYYSRTCPGPGFPLASQNVLKHFHHHLLVSFHIHPPVADRYSGCRLPIPARTRDIDSAGVFDGLDQSPIYRVIFGTE